MIPSYFTHGNDIHGSVRESSSPATTLVNNNSQDLYAEVSDVTLTTGLLSTFNNHPSFQHPSSMGMGDPEPYATTTLAMHNTTARMMVIYIFFQSHFVFKQFLPTSNPPNIIV